MLLEALWLQQILVHPETRIGSVQHLHYEEILQILKLPRRPHLSHDPMKLNSPCPTPSRMEKHNLASLSHIHYRLPHTNP